MIRFAPRPFTLEQRFLLVLILASAPLANDFVTHTRLDYYLTTKAVREYNKTKMIRNEMNCKMCRIGRFFTV